MSTRPIQSRSGRGGTAPTTATVVVGVDGSESAQEALRFAVGEARLRGAGLRVVNAWYPAKTAITGFASDRDPTVFVDNARAALETALDAIGDHADVAIEAVVCVGRPAQVLVEEARGADLLVVGARGHGGFAGLRPGSVGHRCSRHSSCPTVIVHQPNRTP